MSHHSQHKHLLTRIQNASHQTVLVAANVEDCTIAHEARRTEVDPNVPPGLPCDSVIGHMRIPRSKRTFGGRVTSDLPEPPQSRLGNDPHPYTLHLSAIQVIVVREIRTGKPVIRRMRTGGLSPQV